MLPFPEGGYDPLKPYLVPGQILNKIFAAIRARTPVAGSNILLEDSAGGFKIHSTATGGSGTGPCAFGEMIETPEEGWAIIGGVVYCGYKNYLVPQYEIPTGADGDFLLYLDFGCEANRDDAGEIFLPGIKTSSESDPSTFFTLTSDASYPDNISPDVADGIGNLIVPIGSITITDSVPSFVPISCGHVTVNQCGGTLSHTRG